MAQVSKFRIHVTPEACIFAAAMLLSIPFPWLSAWVTAAAVHELCHCLALIACGREIEHISIGINGAQIQSTQLTDGETLFCSLAGPLGGIVCLLLGRYFPRFALCALFQSAYNLLPIYPLDGGRALRGLTGILFSQQLSVTICKVVGSIVCISVFIFGAIATIWWKLGLLPIILGTYFVMHMKKIKIPCK